MCHEHRVAHRQDLPGGIDGARVRLEQRKTRSSGQRAEVDALVRDRRIVVAGGEEQEVLAVRQELREAVRRLPGSELRQLARCPAAGWDREQRAAEVGGEDDRAIRAPGSALALGYAAQSERRAAVQVDATQLFT